MKKFLSSLIGIVFAVLIFGMTMMPKDTKNQQNIASNKIEAKEEKKSEDSSVDESTEAVKETASNLKEESKKETSAVITEDIFSGYKLIVVDGGNLSGHREPNVVVDIGFEGHVIADSLGGVSNAYNITPQNSILNRHGDQAYMEKVIRDAGGCTEFVAIITYPDTTTQIPSHYSYTYTINGNVINDEFDNVNPDEYNASLETNTSTNNSNSSNNTNTTINNSGSTSSTGKVYWTPNGNSYHTTKGCSTLSRSKTILEGTIQESGKNDPCDRCH